MSVRAGISNTTVVSGCLASSEHFFTQSLIARPYGGLQKTVCPPRLLQSIVRFGKVSGAFMIGLVSAGVEGEVKLRVQFIKECLRCRPVHNLGREHDFGIHLFHLIVDLLENGLICNLLVVSDFDFHAVCNLDSYLSLFCPKRKEYRVVMVTN